MPVNKNNIHLFVNNFSVIFNGTRAPHSITHLIMHRKMGKKAKKFEGKNGHKRECEEMVSYYSGECKGQCLMLGEFHSRHKTTSISAFQIDVNAITPSNSPCTTPIVYCVVRQPLDLTQALQQ